MKRLDLTEGEWPREIPLAAEHARAIADSGIAAVTPTSDAGVWTVATGTKVGALRVGDLDVLVRPKVPIRRLLFLMSYGRGKAPWTEDLVDLDDDHDLPSTLAHAFVALARRALEQGLLKGYRRVDESAPVLRGRLRESDQIRHRWGLNMPLEITYDDYSVDIPENQLILAATLRLLRMPGVDTTLRPALQRLRLQLADVSAPAGKTQLPNWQPSRLNARYVPALSIAELILRGDSFENRFGDTKVSGYLVNMAQVFEDFVCVALADALRKRHAGGTASLQYRTHLDEDAKVPIRPDFTWLREGAPVIVGDAKYKAEKPAGFPQADLYQMLAYCTVLGLDTGHLVYAKGEEATGPVEIAGSSVTVHRHALDVTEPPEQILEQVDLVASAMAATLPGQSGHADYELNALSPRALAYRIWLAASAPDTGPDPSWTTRESLDIAVPSTLVSRIYALGIVEPYALPKGDALGLSRRDAYTELIPTADADTLKTMLTYIHREDYWMNGVVNIVQERIDDGTIAAIRDRAWELYYNDPTPL